MNKPTVEVLKFERVNQPIPYEDVKIGDNEKMVNYGTDNRYPDFLLKLYSESPIHSAIINAKTTYLIGDGLRLADGKAVDSQVNDGESFNEFISKCIKDYLLFNYFAVEVIYNSFRQPIEYHWIPAHKVRTNKAKTKFWYCEDWSKKVKSIQYDRFKLNSDTDTSKIFFFDGYFPSLTTVYPSPEYNGCLKSINTDISIRDFNLNNIKNHFSVSTLITFFNGSNLPDEVKKQVVKDIKDSYQGENGKKVIVDFQNTNGKPADVKNISPNEWDKAYSVIAQNVADDIYRGHQVTSPMLMGVKTEGQLGGATELETAYEIFKNTYIRQKRSELEGAFNLLFSNSTIINGSLLFTDRPLFNTQLSDSLKEKIFTINELRKEAGLPALANGNRLLNEEASSEPISKDNWNKVSLQPEDFEKVAHLGSYKKEYEVISYERKVFGIQDALKQELHFDKQEDIAKWVIDNDIKNATYDSLVESLKSKGGVDTSVSELKDILAALEESEVIDVVANSNSTINVIPNKTADIPETGRVLTMYEYIKRPEASGDTLLSSSRSFCRKLIENDKYYSREDIQVMSSIFGYDVFEHGGGFWHDPTTGDTKSHCRHKFQTVRVKRK